MLAKLKNLSVGQLLLSFFFIMFAIGSVYGQDKFVIATGDAAKGSVYGRMGKELAGQCSAYIAPTVIPGGGTGNRDALVSNKVHMSIIQADMLEFTRRTDPEKVANVKTLFTLHKEEIHIIARADVKKEGGILGTNFNAKSIKFDTVANLAGRTVGAVGGSVDSGLVLSNTSGLNFKVQRVADNDALKASLLNGTYDAIIVVGGAKHPLVESLDTRFKLLPIPKEVQDKLIASKLYTSARLSYDNLRATGIQSVATQAIIVTRTFRNPATAARLKEARECFTKAAYTLSDELGTHEKWRTVNPEDKGLWPWYDL